MQMILALIGGFVGARWNTTNYTVVNYLKRAPGPDDKADEGQQSFSYYLVQYFGTWLLIFTNFVPISLTVTLEVVKFWHAMFMGMDHTMYDAEQDVGMKA
jgi:phospholipid-transporting ATPase|tara:strand:+ start:387 stop:686 length:300 start_codon:yes stop_codon:yes gene_type:complete